MSAHPSQQPRQHCHNGHPLEGDNLALTRDYRPNGKPRVRRRCKACARADWHARRKHMRIGS